MLGAARGSWFPANPWFSKVHMFMVVPVDASCRNLFTHIRIFGAFQYWGLLEVEQEDEEEEEL